MSRLLGAVDRTLCLLFGLLLIATGVLVVTWAAIDFPSIDRLDLGTASELGDTSWWSYASGGAAIVLVILSLWWLVPHIRSHRVQRLAVPGSSNRARFEVEPAAMLDVAAETLEATVGVRTASGRIVKDRGQLVAVMSARLDPAADLALVGEACNEVSRQLGTTFGRPELRGRFELSVARKAKSLPRVD